MRPKTLLCLALVLSGGLFGCAGTDRARPEPSTGASTTAVGKVFVMTNSPASTAWLGQALPQLGPGHVVFKTSRPVTTALQALPEIEKFSGMPIVAVCEYKGWFCFATGVARDSEGKEIDQIICGYAVKRGDRGVKYWSVW
jgi:hypothetical protein